MGQMERLTDAYAPAFDASSRAIFLHFINISLKYKYVYLATPKVACSSILQTLQRLELSDTNFMHSPPSEIHDRRFSPLLTPLQVPDFRAFSLRADVTTFCFVRNPYDRLLSCYLEKVRDGHLSPRFLSKLKRHQGPVSFSEFLSVISQERTEDMEPHYAVQYLQTFQDYLPFKFVGRFERLEADLNRLSQVLQVDLTRWSVRVDPHKTGGKEFRDYFDDAAIEFVRDRYRADFESFGYSIDLPC